MAAPAVAKIITSGVIASVYCRNQEAPCNKKLMLVLVIFGGLSVIKVQFTSKKLQVPTSLVWRNKDTSRIKLSSLFVDFKTSCAHAALNTQTLQRKEVGPVQ